MLTGLLQFELLLCRIIAEQTIQHYVSHVLQTLNCASPCCVISISLLKFPKTLTLSVVGSFVTCL